MSRTNKRKGVSLTLGYLLAIGAIVLATVVTKLLESVVDPFSLFFAAVALTGFFAGAGPGIVSVILATLAIELWFIEPIGVLTFSASTVLRMTVFMTLALLVSWLSAERKRTVESLQQANDALEARVLDRTSELTKSKDLLEAEIRERRQASEELQEKVALLDLTHDTVMVRDLDECIRYWNRGAEETYGYTPAEALGTVSHTLLKTIFPIPLEAIKTELSRTGRWSGELIHTSKDGLSVVASSRWALRKSVDGEPLGVLEINNDITDRRTTEEALRRTQSELAHVTRMMTMGEMVSTITHEVNQPLCAIVTNGNACSRWLRTVPPDLERAEGALQRIIRDGNRASDVIARIRTLVKKTDGYVEPVRITDIIEDVLLVTEYDTQRSGIVIEKRYSPAIPIIPGDRVGLQQVVLNLVLNAIDAMRAANSRPSQLAVHVESHGSGVLVEVEDSGPGIPPENLERIFDAFFTTKKSGMGMGLSICRSIVQNHAGEIWATSDKGGGTAFHFTLAGAKTES